MMRISVQGLTQYAVCRKKLRQVTADLFGFVRIKSLSAKTIAEPWHEKNHGKKGKSKP